VVRSVGPWRRWAVVLLVLSVAVPAAILAKGGEGGPIPERETSCWPCHVGWAVPLRTLYTIIPPAEAGANVGEEFEYVVRVQGGWVPPGDGPYLKLIAPTLDISGAPSLQFAGGPEPLAGVELQAAAVLQSGVPPVPPPTSGGPPVARGHVVQPIPDGVTYIRVTLAPANPTGQTQFRINVYPGATEPAGAPAYTARAPAPGAPIVLELLTAQDVAGYGTGNWTIEGVVDNYQDLGVPDLAGQRFIVTVEARAETSDLTSLPLAFATNVAKGASFLFTYGLEAGRDPAAGEQVFLTVNTTEYYKHKDSSTDDWANVTKEFGDPLLVQKAADGRVVIVGPSEPPGPPAPFNGWSVDTLSEAVGYASAFLLISSIWTGGMFGKASRRQLNTVFGSAKRRVAFHNFLSYGIILAATVHTVLFIVETAYYWTLGVLWGGLAILGMFGLGLTGAYQVGMIRKWSYGFWRWSHYGLACAAILFTLVHMALDGVHFGFIQEAIDWNDPLDPREGVQ
jgi:hypothetical protein